MKTIKRNIGRLIVGSALATGLVTNSHAQLQFTAAGVTQEGALQLHWESEPNAVYSIECADQVVDINNGGTVWQTLYTGYPSHGTNTFSLDTGNYLKVPPILHPSKAPMRFYRVVKTGTDETSSEPTIAVTSPTNGSVAAGLLTIKVTASTDQTTLATTLFVDGQQMRSRVANTNWTDDSTVTNYQTDTYTINTCEWPNGEHIIFASATALSAAPGGALGSPPVLEGHAVSAYVPVTFSNLVTRISFSEPFFDPALGQTQQVSAVLAANANWTLNVIDV